MSENLIIPETGERKEIYEALIPQIISLIEDETNLIANTANIAAALKQAFDFFWVGFYFDDKNGELVLGPFQGPIACTRIKYNKGVCGAAFSTELTQIVPDVDAFPGHIACSSLSKSEIVLPLKNKTGKTIGVLDIDSDSLNDFNSVDQQYLEQLLLSLSRKIED